MADKGGRVKLVESGEFVDTSPSWKRWIDREWDLVLGSRAVAHIRHSERLCDAFGPGVLCVTTEATLSDGQQWTIETGAPPEAPVPGMFGRKLYQFERWERLIQVAGPAQARYVVYPEVHDKLPDTEPESFRVEDGSGDLMATVRSKCRPPCRADIYVTRSDGPEASIRGCKLIIYRPTAMDLAVVAWHIGTRDICYTD